MFLVFDTETTGLPLRDNAPLSDFDNWPRAVQIAWQLHDDQGKLIEAKDYVIRPDGFDIPYNTAKFHGITTAVAQEYGVDLAFAMEEFSKALAQTKFIVGHNLAFDNNILGCEYLRLGQENLLANYPVLEIGRAHV